MAAPRSPAWTQRASEADNLISKRISLKAGNVASVSSAVCDCYQSIRAVQRESVSPHPPYTWYVATSQPRTLHWDTEEGWEGKLKQLKMTILKCDQLTLWEVIAASTDTCAAIKYPEMRQLLPISTVIVPLVHW